jgi:hypothetical protein
MEVLSRLPTAKSANRSQGGELARPYFDGHQDPLMTTPLPISLASFACVSAPALLLFASSVDDFTTFSVLCSATASLDLATTPS